MTKEKEEDDEEARPEDEENFPEPEEQKQNFQFSLSVGELSVQSKSLTSCKRMIKTLLRDKDIKNYLGVQQIRRDVATYSGMYG